MRIWAKRMTDIHGIITIEGFPDFPFELWK